METNKSIRFARPDTMPPTFGYSHIVEVKNARMLYISGQIALDNEGQLVGEGDLAAQTRQVFENIRLALETEGASFADVIKLTFFMVDISQMASVREVRDQYINLSNPPASSAVEVRRLIREDLLIEVEAIAAVAMG
ncbi:enamine deaminase RidA [Paenibacillus yonginensis]|uniref:Enamine deaminase RidA n=1 Tax=Paenibacillus yonginensis TaxID=1462996 RepID=A0A1B1MZS8_9BACL|nr:RidA family protein [Paenibacillus yonginensis]ANS74677.1 enamine deaminase RidA [Paenibacillus yonginensis]